MLPFPQMVQNSHLALSFTRAHLWNTPLCNISCDHVAIHHTNQTQNRFAILSECIATGIARNEIEKISLWGPSGLLVSKKHIPPCMPCIQNTITSHKTIHVAESHPRQSHPSQCSVFLSLPSRRSFAWSAWSAFFVLATVTFLVVSAVSVMMDTPPSNCTPLFEQLHVVFNFIEPTEELQPSELLSLNQEPKPVPYRDFRIKSKILLRVGQEKANKHKHFGRDGVWDKQEPSLGQTGPLPGTNWDPSLGQTGLSLLNSTVRSPFCPVCPWDGWGSSLGRLSHKGHQKNMDVFFKYISFVFEP